MIMSSNAKIGMNPDVLEGKGSQTPPDFDGVSNLAEVPQIDRPRVEACQNGYQAQIQRLQQGGHPESVL